MGTHFLVDTLCRMWAFKFYRKPNTKILYHGSESARTFFETKFASDIFTALGLSEADFIQFNEPTILNRVVIPNPSFEELNFAHKSFAEFMNDVGLSLAGDTHSAKNDNPVYLTKMNIKFGISHYINEEEFVNVLSKAGGEIIAPETLLLKQQIDIFKTRSVITGLTGSAFHTSLFVPKREMLILNYHDTVWSNQILMDKANGNETRFVYDSAGDENKGNDQKFLNNFVMAKPAELAEDFLREIDGLLQRIPLNGGNAESRSKISQRNLAHQLVVEFQGAPSAVENASLSTTELSDHDLLEKFQSIGLNCEFGVVQRRVGIEKLGLLKWCVSEPHMLINALKARFEGIGEPGNVVISAQGWEYDIVDLKYGFRGHSLVGVDTILKAQFQGYMEKRLQFLRRKLIEDLESDDPIFVYKQNGDPFDTNLIQEITDQISSYGSGLLLWVCEAGFTGKQAGTADLISSNLMQGHISRLAPYDK
jgi:hypothetical protein